MMMPQKKMDPSVPSNHASPPQEVGTLEQTEMEQVLSDLQSLKTLYGLLLKGPADENLDETSRAFLMRMLDDATQQTLLKQAKMLTGSLMFPSLERKLSIQPNRRTRGNAVPSLKPIASFSPSFHASERSSRLRTQGTVRTRDSRHGEDDRLLARVDSNRSSRTALPHRHQSPEQRLARLPSHRSSRAVTPQHSTVAGGTPRSDRRGDEHVPRCGSGGGDQSSMERGSGRGRSPSREPSAVQEMGQPLHRGASAAAWRVGAEGSSTRRLGRMDFGLSVSVVPRRGSQRASRGAATPNLSSSSDAAATIRSRIRPNRDIMERSLRRAGEAEEESLRRRRGKNVADAASVNIGYSSRPPRRTLNQINSGSTYSSGGSSHAAASYASCSPTEPWTSGASPSSSSRVSSRGNAPPVYAFDVPGPSTSRHRPRHWERQERKEGRLKKLKDKLALVFHHRHDLHHHHHFGMPGNQGGLLSNRDRRLDYHRMSPWKFLGDVFHRAKKRTRSVQAKRRGGALFDALPRRIWDARRAPASNGMWRTGSRLKEKKLNWLQRIKPRRGRRSGLGKVV